MAKRKKIITSAPKTAGQKATEATRRARDRAKASLEKQQAQILASVDAQEEHMAGLGLPKNEFQVDGGAPVPPEGPPDPELLGAGFDFEDSHAVLQQMLSRAEKNKTLKKKDRKLLRQFAAAQKVANRR